ncbi:electron transport protein SCO1/SenC [Parafrankia sp. EUN1f]|nr:electron transport protein SCO1/SenC [Parafrankia sp. EUN1f]
MVAAAIAMAGCGAGTDTPGTVVDLSQVEGAAGVRGITLATPMPKPTTALTDTAGKPFDLRAATAGKLTLVFFGFTNCPDICPTTMADLAAARSLLGAADQAQLRVVFVATDPARDTPAAVRRWLGQFDSSFIGVTGTWDDVAHLADQLGVPVQAPRQGSDGSWTVTHGSQVTAFSPDGVARVAYQAGTSVEDYAHDIPLLLRGEV